MSTLLASWPAPGRFVVCAGALYAKNNGRYSEFFLSSREGVGLRLPAVPVTSFEDATLNMEALQGQTVIGATRGVTTVTWPGASPNTTLRTVAHGLGQKPTVVVCSDQGGTTFIGTPETSAYTATTFSVQVGTLAGGSPAAGSTQTLGWLAIP